MSKRDYYENLKSKIVAVFADNTLLTQRDAPAIIKGQHPVLAQASAGLFDGGRA
jgi:hypothetical protein